VNRTNVLRAAYLAAAAATCGVGWLLASGRLFEFMFSITGEAPAGVELAVVPARIMGVAALTAFAGAFLWLARRPQWWGKLLCAWAGFSWTMFSLAIHVVAMGQPVPTDIAVIPLVCGLTVLAAGVLHQILEPGFGPLTAKR
jgi:hypothetical protein